jgi:ABC-type transport system substrate-binding protein
VPSVETQPFERLALMLQKQLFDAGIDMELELVEPQDFMRRLGDGRFDAALFELFVRTPSWVHAFWRSPRDGSNVGVRHGYTGADRELDAMHLAETDQELQKAIAAVYRRMSEDPPAVFIAWPQTARAVSTRFEVPVEPGSDIMGSNLRLWRPAQQQPAGTR